MSKNELRRRYLAEDPHCRYCGFGPLRLENSTLDHIEPKSRGGTDDPANLLLSCFRCNQRKADRELSDITVARFRSFGIMSRHYSPPEVQRHES